MSSNCSWQKSYKESSATCISSNNLSREAFCHLPFFDLPVHVSRASFSDVGWIQSQVPFPSYTYSSGLSQLSLKIHSTNNNKNLKVTKKKIASRLLQTSSMLFVILLSSCLPSVLIIWPGSPSVSLYLLFQLRRGVPFPCLTERWRSWIRTQYFVPHYCSISSLFSALLARVIYTSIKV